jgi:hypothetical protein
MFGYVVCFVVDMRRMKGEKWGFSMRKKGFFDGFFEAAHEVSGEE